MLRPAPFDLYPGRLLPAVFFGPSAWPAVGMWVHFLPLYFGGLVTRGDNDGKHVRSAICFVLWGVGTGVLLLVVPARDPPSARWVSGPQGEVVSRTTVMMICFWVPFGPMCTGRDKEGCVLLEPRVSPALCLLLPAVMTRSHKCKCTFDVALPSQASHCRHRDADAASDRLDHFPGKKFFCWTGKGGWSEASGSIAVCFGPCLQTVWVWFSC